MRYLYYCNSPYQLMNILNLNWHRKYDNFENIENYSSELIIIDSFEGANGIFNIVKNFEEFDNVVLAKRFKNEGKLHSLSSFLDIIFPIRFLKKSGEFTLKSVINKYDIIAVPKISKIPLSILHYNKKATIQLFEEGMGSYYGGEHMCHEGGTHQNLYKIINGGREISQYINIYLNDKRLYLGNDIKKVIDIPKFNNDYLNSLKEKFNDLLFKEKDRKIYWIGQYLKDDTVNNTINSVLSMYGDDVIYCPHPRFKLEETSRIKSLENNKLWELSALDIKNMEEKVFVSLFSTAIFSSKLLYDKEPYVVFCSKLIANKEDEHIKKIQKIIDIFKTTYRDPNKVFIPNNKEEFIEALNKCMNNRF